MNVVLCTQIITKDNLNFERNCILLKIKIIFILIALCLILSILRGALMKKLNVLHLINNLSSGGAENALINYLNYDNNNINYLFRLSNISKNNVLLLEKNVVDLNPEATRRYGLFTFLKILRIAKTLKPDVIHAHLFPSFYFAAIISLFVKSKFVVTEHSLSNSRRSKAFRFIEKLIYSRFHSIISVSDEVRHSLSQWLNDNKKLNHKVIPNGINVKQFIDPEDYDLKQELSFKEDDIVIMVIARLTREKNLFVPIESMIHLPFNYKLVLVGDGHQESFIRDKIRELNLETRVRILGFRKNISSLLHNADIFLLPSKEEGFGISVLEAVASNRRILLSNIPTFISLYKEINPTYFEVDSSIDLAVKIKLSLSTSPNYSLYDKLINKYDIKNSVKMINELYQDLTKNL
jgi:glycosyltransferase involved in cell wall biosynthesis